jgi:ABC-type transport system substrate-binding protein
MMKTRLLPILSLLAVLLAACAPASAAPNPPAAATQTLIQPSGTSLAAPTFEPATEAVVPTEALAGTPPPIATSRGPDLEATDPSTVNLASGQVQFIEFFRFT